MFTRMYDLSIAGTCAIYGNVHVLTFDKASFDYQGLCKYRMAYYCGSDPALPAFTINAIGATYMDSGDVAQLYSVQIIYDRHMVHLGPGSSVAVCYAILVIPHLHLIA